MNAVSNTKNIYVHTFWQLGIIKKKKEKTHKTKQKQSKNKHLVSFFQLFFWLSSQVV